MKSVLANQELGARRLGGRGDGSGPSFSLALKVFIVAACFFAAAWFVAEVLLESESSGAATAGDLLIEVGADEWARVGLRSGILTIERLSTRSEFSVSKGDLRLPGGTALLGRLIDALGGIPLELRERIEYPGSDGLKARLEPGRHLVDADRVEVYLNRPGVRRAASIRVIVMAAAERAKELEASGISVRPLLSAAMEASGAGIPAGASDVFVNLLFSASALSSADIDVKWPDPAPREALSGTPVEQGESEPPPSILRVRILNATGKAGLAARIAKRFPASRFRIVETGNASGLKEKTAVRAAELGTARRVAAALGFGDAQMGSPGASADAEVILGRDSL